MTDSPPTESDAAAPLLFLQNVVAATDALQAAQDVERLSMEVWVAAIETGDPKSIERAKIDLDRAGRGITESYRLRAMAQSSFDTSIRSTEAEAVRHLMHEVEAGAERRGIATINLMQVANSQTASLKWATRALAFATIVLAVATVVLIFVTANA